MGKRGATSTGRPGAGGADRPPAAPPCPAPPDPGAALVALFNDARDELLSTLAYVLGNADDAQDAAQEAFLKCWRTRHTSGDVRNLRAWVFRVALNTAKDHRRSAWSRRSRPLPEDDVMTAAHADAPDVLLDDRDAVARLAAAITHLRPEEQEVFLLRQNGELTYEQIAEARQAPVGTVKTQMRTALQKLRRVLNPEPSVHDD